MQYLLTIIIKIEIKDLKLKKQLNVLHGLLVYLSLNNLDQIHYQWFVLMSKVSYIPYGLALRVKKKMVQKLNQDSLRTWVYLLKKKRTKPRLDLSPYLLQERETGSSKRRLLLKIGWKDTRESTNLFKVTLGEIS